MQIKLPEGLTCKWCTSPSLNLVDVYTSYESFQHVDVVLHCTWCDRCQESISPIIDDVITPRLDPRRWRSTHNPPRDWPYGTATTGRYRVYQD